MDQPMQTSNYLQIAKVCIALQVIKTLLLLSLAILCDETDYYHTEASHLFSHLLLLS